MLSTVMLCAVLSVLVIAVGTSNDYALVWCSKVFKFIALNTGLVGQEPIVKYFMASNHQVL
jgi:hypothetical protein